MKRFNSVLCGLLAFIFNTSASFSQFLAINPPEISFTIESAVDVHELPGTVVLAVNSDAANWNIHCTAQGFLSQNSANSIPEWNLFLHHEYSPTENMGAGMGYQRMNNSIVLASGIATNGEYKVVNTLSFKFQVPSVFIPDLYRGEVQLQYFDNLGRTEEVVLNLALQVNRVITITSSPLSLNFHTFREPGLYQMPDNLSFQIYSNNNECNLRMIVSPFIGNHGEKINSDIVFANVAGVTKCGDLGAGPDYAGLNEPYDFPMNLNYLESEHALYSGSGELRFKLRTGWQHRPGDYTATLQLIPLAEPATGIIVSLTLNIAEFSVMSLSESSIHFHANGPPALWDGDKSVKLFVGSNCNNWSVTGQATNLAGSKSIIDSKRLFIKKIPDGYDGDDGAGIGYRSLENQIEIVTGSQIAPTDVCQMLFKLKTLETDRPGHYEGTITFTMLANP
ncbi:hypothetical protein JXJ21_17175 [candidate division KSB1 bacterium]|nr:hypothetical protein [candidate division KSB1 bacterium]